MSHNQTGDDKPFTVVGENNSQQLATAMKLGMRHLAGGVAVFVTQHVDGVPQGMTVTAVTSLSDAPPSLLVCLHRETGSLRALKSSQTFSINVLSADQVDISNMFAFSQEGENRFTCGTWLKHKSFQPLYLQGALATFFCRSDRLVDYGTHCIVIGLIEEVMMSTQSGEPLLYFDGGYCGLNRDPKKILD